MMTCTINEMITIRDFMYSTNANVVFYSPHGHYWMPTQCPLLMCNGAGCLATNKKMIPCPGLLILEEKRLGKNSKDQTATRTHTYKEWQCAEGLLKLATVPSLFQSAVDVFIDGQEERYETLRKHMVLPPVDYDLQSVCIRLTTSPYALYDLRKSEWSEEWFERIRGFPNPWGTVRCTLPWFVTLRTLKRSFPKDADHHAKFLVSDVLDFQSLFAYSETDVGEHMRLLLSGDVETNPGPVQSRPLPVRYNDPRTVKLENAIQRRDEKIRTLISHLRRQCKDRRNKIFVQMFDGVTTSLTAAQREMAGLNGNLERVCDFLDKSLPTLTDQVTKLCSSGINQYVSMKNDLMALTIVCLFVKLFMCLKKYKLAIVILLIFTLRYFNIDSKVIQYVCELRDSITSVKAQFSCEDVLYHSYYPMCGKFLFAFLAFLAVKKLPGKSDWDNYLLRLDRIPKAFAGANKIVDYCSEYFELATDQVKTMVLGKSHLELKRFRSQHEEVKEWASQVRKYVDLEERNKIDVDIEIANEVESLYRRGLEFQADALMDRELQRLVSITLVPARELFQYVSSSPIKGGGPRMRPICLWLVGESGIGKTEMVYPLCIDVLRSMGLMRREDFHHQVYGRQVETEFWDGYKGQKIVIYDDAFQKKDDKVTGNPEIFEVIRSCNTFPQHLHMAALHDKNTFSAAELLIYTTNDCNVSLESITFPQAFYNRIGEHAYRVQPKAEFSKLIGSTKKRTLDLSKINKDIPIDLSVYEFQKMQYDSTCDKKWVDVGSPIDYTTFAEFVCNEWKTKKQQSLSKLKFLEEYAIRAQVGDEQFYACEYNSEFFLNDIKVRQSRSESLLDIEASYAEDDKLWEAYMNHKSSVSVAPTSKWDVFRSKIDVAMTRARGYANECMVRMQEVWNQHPILVTSGIVGTIIAVVGLTLNLFGTLGEKVDESESECDSRFVSADAEVSSSGDVRTGRATVRVVEVGVSGDAKTPRARVAQIESNLDKQLHTHVVAQGCSDAVAHKLVTDVLTKNTYRLTYERNGVDVAIGNCTFLRGWVCMIPYHFLSALYARKLAPSAVISFSQSKYANIIQIPLSHFINVGVDDFSLTDNCVQVKFADDTDRDCVLVNLCRKMCHPHRDILKHFVRKSDQGKLVGKFNGTLATYHHSGGELYRAYQWLQSIRPMDKEIEICMPEDGYVYPVQSYTQRDCYEYNAPTQIGDCGSIVGIYNQRLERKLCGMHIAGTKAEYGYACPLTQEALETALLQLEKSSSISAQFYFESPSCVDAESECEVPSGLFCPIGKSELRVGQATKTSLLPSKLHGCLSTPIMCPAILKPTVIDGELVDPLLKGLAKCGVATAIIPDQDVRDAALDVCQVVLNQYNTQLDKTKYQRVLTYEEAVRGTLDDDFMRAVNRTTSPGFPYLLDNKGSVGKTKWMGSSEDFDFTSKAALALRADVESLIANCKNGILRDVVFVDTLKDEKRELGKVAMGKTRVFSAGPQHFVIAFRQYFLPFSAWLMHNRIDNEVAVGTNPYSVDWHRIAKRLQTKGPNVIAGDFGNFDGTLCSQVLWSIFFDIYVPWLESFIDLKTPKGGDHYRVCFGLWAHLVHSVHIFGDNVYMWTHSQPSGNPFTVIINCLYNSMIMRLAWIKIMSTKNPSLRSMRHFRKYVSMISYGDDNCLNISNSVLEYYNQLTISEAMTEMRHEYTDESKIGELVKSRTLSDVSFLKRSFVYDPSLCRYVAPLKKSVIYEMLNWTRNTIDPDVILMDNIDVAMREIVLHGRAEYEELRDGIVRNLGKLPQIPQILSFEQYKYDFANAGDDLYAW